MKEILIRFRDYDGIEDFLRAVFYRNNDLVVPALKFLKKVYSGEMMYTRRWRAYISELFGVFPLDEDDETVLRAIISRYTPPTGRGKKPFLHVLNSSKNQLTEDEKDVLKRAIEWNSITSKYYSIIKKLESVGLMEKKNGRYIKSSKLNDRAEKITKLMYSLNERDYVYSGK